MGESFKAMRIDENAEELNISDHNLIRSWFKIGRKGGTSWRKSKIEVRTWYSINAESLNKMEKDLEKRTRGPISFNSMMKKIELTQERHLKKTRKIRVGMKGKKLILAAVWIDVHAQIYIKMRKMKSRAWRYARRRNAPREEIALLKLGYEQQQKATSIYLGTRKGDWEKRKVLEAKTNSKILWNIAKDIAGKTKKKDEQVYVYTENKERRRIEVVWVQFIYTWKTDIYQKKQGCR